MSKKMPTPDRVVRVQSPGFQASQLFVTAARQLHEALRPHLEATFAERASSGGFLADVIPWYRVGAAALVGPVLGPAAMQLALRPFLESGCTEVTFLGFCGGLAPDKAVADIVLPLGVCADDDRFLPLRQQGLDLTQTLPPSSRTWLGTIAATPHPYDIDAARIAHWKRNDCTFVEMELIAVADLQAQYTFQLRAFCIVSDFLDEQGRQSSGLQSKALKLCAERLCAHIAAPHSTAKSG